MIEKYNGVKSNSRELAHPERRRDRRYPFSATVEAVELKSKTRILGRASDLSKGGCFVDTMSSFPPDTVVRMRLKKDSQSFEALATVAYSMDGMGMGVKFTPAEPEQTLILKKWIGELNGELVPESEIPEPVEQSRAQEPTKSGPYCVLNELLIELMRQRLLSEAKGNALLELLHCNEQADLNLSTAKLR